MRWASKILLIIAVGIVSYTGALFFIDLYQYNLLSRSSPIKITRWEIKPLEGDLFAIEARFLARGKERTYQFVKPIFQNPVIAREHIQLWEKASWEVFFHPKKDLFALQKFFPFMKGIRFVLSLGVVLWFVYLFEANLAYRQET